MEQEDIEKLFQWYVEENEFLTLPDVALYLYLQSSAKRGRTIRDAEVAKFMGEDVERLIKRYDRLENCLLITNIPRGN